MVEDPEWEALSKESGEIRKLYSKVVVESQEEFVKIYLNSIDDLIQLDNRMLQVLMVCLKESKFCEENNKDGNILYNFKEFKNKCRERIDKTLTDKAINQQIYKLVTAQILIRKSRGELAINPRYFIKGSMTPMTRLKLVVEYEGQHEKKTKQDHISR